MMKRNPLRSGMVSFVAILLLALAVTGFVPSRVCADDVLDAKQLVEKARMTLETFAVARETEAFRNLVKDAKGIYIAPQVIRGAFIIGASGGSGVFLAKDQKTGEWAGPAFYTIGGASFGLQAGGDVSEVILVAMTDRGVKAMLGSSVKLGADLSVAAGPVGVGTAASTANLSADIVSFSRAKGLFGGLSLEGAVIKTRGGLNDAYYGKKVTPTDILIKHTATNPNAAGLINLATKISKGK